MNVSLTPELERLVADKVVGGRYASVSEVVREALRLLEERDAMREAKIEALRRKVCCRARESRRGAGVARHRRRHDPQGEGKARTVSGYTLSEEAGEDLDEIWGYVYDQDNFVDTHMPTPALHLPSK